MTACFEHATCLSLFLQDRLQLVELGLHGVHQGIGLLQLVKPVTEAVCSLPILCLLFSQQAGVQADEVRVTLGAGVVPVPAAAWYEEMYLHYWQGGHHYGHCDKDGLYRAV